MSHKKVLVIAYAFPPVGGAGVQRTVKFSKYLPMFGWSPIVLSVQNPSVPLKDMSFLNDLRGIPIYRAFSFEPGYWLKRKTWDQIYDKSSLGNKSFLSKLFKILKDLIHFLVIPDPQIGWIPLAFLKGLHLIFNDKIDLIFVSAPPFSSFVLGMLLSWVSRKPWVADFRDEWVSFYVHAYDSHRRSFGNNLVQRLEKLIFKSATRIITATEGISKNYQQLYPYYSDKIFTITNGFDPDDFGLKSTHKKGNKFNMLYTGTVFGVTSALPFLSALHEIIQENPHIKDILSVDFIGRIVDSEQETFSKYNCGNVIKQEPYLAHQFCVRRLYDADVLLLFIADIPGANRILTGKIFEYIAARKEILAVVPEGEAASLIRKLDIGVVVSPYDKAAIKAAILEFIHKWSDDMLNRNPLEEGKVNLFSRKTLTEKLVDIFNSIQLSR